MSTDSATASDLDRLRTGLDETEAWARYATGDHNDAEPHWTHPVSGVVNVGGTGLDALIPTGDSAIASHIAHNDPARMLGWVRAVRGILATYEHQQARADAATIETGRYEEDIEAGVLREVVQALADVYRGDAQ